MPPVLTFGLLIILIVFIIIARGLVHRNYEEAGIVAMSSNVWIMNNSELNEVEGTVLTLLYSVMNLSNQEEGRDTYNSVYYCTLEEYLSRDEVSLSDVHEDDLKEKLIELQDIINYEGQVDFSKMSLDSRKIAVYLSEQIYKICGLSIGIDMEGNISKISDLSGNIIYSNLTTKEDSFHLNALIITLALILVLLSICIIIAKKNQLFNKEVNYDGFDEERFA